jgi:hypothetical protein
LSELARDLRVTFIVPKEPPSNTVKASSTEHSRKTLAANSLGAKKKTVTTPDLWLRMIQKKGGNRWVTPNSAEASHAEGCCIDKIFQSQGKAEAWLLDGRDKEDSSDEEIPDLISCHAGYESDDSSVPPQDCNEAG